MDIELIHRQINEAMQQIATEHGLIYTPNTFKYNSNECWLTVQLVNPGNSEAPNLPGGIDAIRMGMGRPGNKATVFVEGRSQVVTITKNTGRGRYFFVTESGRHMVGHYNLFATA